MFRWMKRKNKDKDVRERMTKAIEEQQKAAQESLKRLSQFRLVERRMINIQFDGPERRHGY